MSFRKFLAESQLLLEYDKEKTWSQHGKNAIQHAYHAASDALDDHPLVKGIKRDVDKAVEQGHSDPHALKTHDNEGEEVVNLHAHALLDNFEKTDPTPQKKYVQHIARIYGKGGVNRFEDLHSRMRPALEKFDDLAKRKIIPAEHRDIGRYKSLDELEDVVDAHADKLSGKEEDRKLHDEMSSMPHATVTDKGSFTHIVPHTQKAASHWGKGTRWCTTSEGAGEWGVEGGETMFDHYNSDGPLQIMIPKKPSYQGEKYQYHYASGQMMNEKDHPVDTGDPYGPKGHPDINKYVDDYHKNAEESTKTFEDASNHPEPRVLSKFLEDHGTHYDLHRYIESDKINGHGADKITNNPNFDSTHIDKMLDHSDPAVRSGGFLTKHFGKKQFDRAINDPDEGVRYNALDAVTNGGMYAGGHHDKSPNDHPDNHATADQLHKLYDDHPEQSELHDSMRQLTLLNKNADSALIYKGLKDKSDQVRMNAINNPNSHRGHLDVALKDNDRGIIEQAVRHKDFDTNGGDLEELAKHPNGACAELAVTHPHAVDETLDIAQGHSDERVRRKVANSRSAATHHLENAMKDEDEMVRTYAAGNRNVTGHILDMAMKDSSSKVKLSAMNSQQIQPHHLDMAAQDPDIEVRAAAFSPYIEASNLVQPHHTKAVFEHPDANADPLPMKVHQALSNVAASDAHNDETFKMAFTHRAPRIRLAALTSHYAKPEHRIAALDDEFKEMRRTAVSRMRTWDEKKAAISHPNTEVQDEAYKQHYARVAPSAIPHDHVDAVDRVVDRHHAEQEEYAKEMVRRRSEIKARREARDRNNGVLESFKSFVTESQLLLEYDADKTWKQHGPKVRQAADNAFHQEGDEHPVIWHATHVPHDSGGGVPHEDPHTPEADAHMRQHLLPHFEATDPTGNKKYVQHIARIFGSGGVNRFEDLHARMRPALAKFDDLAKRKIIPAEHRDIGRIKSLGQLEDIVDAHADEQSGKEASRAEHEAMKSQATITDHEDFTHIIPHTQEAATHFGRGTRWCTTSSETYGAGETMFNHYTKEGPLHIFVPKNPTYSGEKYQYHHASGQFMDEKDHAVQWSNLPHKGIKNFMHSYGAELEDASKDREKAMNHPEQNVRGQYLQYHADRDHVQEVLRTGSKQDLRDVSMNHHMGSSIPDRVEQVLKHNPDEDARAYIAGSAHMDSDEHFDMALKDPSEKVNLAAINHTYATSDTIYKGLNHQNPKVRQQALRNINTDTEHVAYAAKLNDPMTVNIAASHERADEDTLVKLAQHRDPSVAWNAAYNKKATDKVLETALKWDHHLPEESESQHPAYAAIDNVWNHSDPEALKMKILDHPDRDIRYTSIHNRAASPMVLNKALDDKSAMVRSAAASNSAATPGVIDKALDVGAHSAVAGRRDLAPHQVDRIVKEAPHAWHRLVQTSLQDESMNNLRMLTPDHINTMLDKGIHQHYDYHTNAPREGDRNKYGDTTHLVMRAPQASSENIDKALNHEDERVRQVALENPNVAPHHVLRALDRDQGRHIAMKAVSHQQITSEGLTKGLQHPDPVVRQHTFTTHRGMFGPEHKELVDKHIKDWNSGYGITAGKIQEDKMSFKGFVFGEYLSELSTGTLNNYIRKANHVVDHTPEDSKVHKKSKKGIERATRKLNGFANFVKEHDNVVDNSGEDLIMERKVLTRDDPAKYATVKRRETKSAKVRSHHTEKEKSMHDHHRTETALKLGFRKRRGDSHHLTDKSGHQLTDRWRDQNRQRLERIRNPRKTVKEGTEYIEARQKLHDAHAEASRQHAGMERDPELRRLDLHRAKKHSIASRVLDILKARTKKTK